MEGDVEATALRAVRLRVLEAAKGLRPPLRVQVRGIFGRPKRRRASAARPLVVQELPARGA